MTTGVAARWQPMVALVAAALLLQLSGALAELRLERGSTLLEPWRLVTAHLVHVGWLHLAMNLVALVLVWALLGSAFDRRHWFAVIVVSGAGVNLGLLAWSPEVQWYAGLSGILHGLVTSALVVRLGKLRAAAVAGLAIVAVKLYAEQHGIATETTAHFIGTPVVFDAHLYGAIAGAGYGFITLLVREARPRPDAP